MSDYIEREFFDHVLRERYEEISHYTMSAYIKERAMQLKQDLQEGIAMAIKELNKMPSADVAEVKHGYWNTRSSSFSSCSVFTECSICGSPGEIYMNYCPHCGAKMDKEQEHE